MTRDIDTAYEYYTDRLYQDRYSTKPEIVECHECEEACFVHNCCRSKLDNELVFCSDYCVDSWEEENKHDYLEVDDV